MDKNIMFWTWWGVAINVGLTVGAWLIRGIL